MLSSRSAGGEGYQRPVDAGVAGEYLTCYRLMTLGYRAYRTEPFSPYDVVIDIDGRLIRVQVKGTAKPCPPENARRARPAYLFTLTHNAPNRKKGPYREGLFDLVAFAALDIGEVAYMTADEVRVGHTFRIPGDDKPSRGALHFADYPIERALERLGIKV